MGDQECVCARGNHFSSHPTRVTSPRGRHLVGVVSLVLFICLSFFCMIFLASDVKNTISS